MGSLLTAPVTPSVDGGRLRAFRKCWSPTNIFDHVTWALGAHWQRPSPTWRPEEQTDWGDAMSTDPIRISREALYEQVWSEPMSKLASHYGLSDVGLAKICRRLRVPVPYRGYWRKREVGQTARRTPLPSLPPSIAPELREVVLRPRSNG